MVTRRNALRAIVGAPAVLRAARRPGDKPNLLFLWTDEQGADTFAAYGNNRYRMPNLNRLAEQSIIFDRCYDTQPVCTPARSSVLTGQWPHQNGCITNNIPLRRETRVLPELLNDAAYKTAYMGKWHLGDEIFAQHGFQQWISVEDYMYDKYYSPGRDRSLRSTYFYYLRELGYKPDRTNGFSRLFTTQLPVDRCKPAFLARHASEFIGRNNGEPWMLYVNFLEPHMPFNGPLNDLHNEEEAPVPTNYPGDKIEREPKFYQDKREKTLKKGHDGQDLKTRAGWQRLNRNYAGMCSQVDTAVGQILGMLEKSGQSENTIIVFTSDHGEMMGAHSLVGKDVFYEEAVRIPMLLRVPFRKASVRRVNQPVSHINLVPTLLDLLGSRGGQGLPGESLIPLTEGRRPSEDHVFIEWHTPPKGPHGRTVISPDGWKLALYDTDTCLLFNRGRDPLELRNLYYSNESGDVIRRLRAKLESWQRRAGDRLKV